MVQTTSVHLQLQQGLARVFVCFLKTKQEQRLRANETISSDDVSLGSGKNGSFDDRTEGSSLHEGNRWLLLLMMMVSVLMMIMVRPLAINDGEANKNDKYEGIFFQSKDT